MAGSYNPTTIFMPGVGYINAQNPTYALPTATTASSIPPPNQQAAVPGMPDNPYLSRVTNTAPNPDKPGEVITSPTNPYQFATPEAAKAIAAQLGGSVSQLQLGGPGNSFSTPQAQVNVPGSANPLNAGLAAKNYGDYGAGPTDLGSYNIQRDLGNVPAGQTQAQWALSNPNFQMNPLLGNSGPGYNMVYNPNTGKYVNNASGTADINGASLSQSDAIGQMRTANGVSGVGPPTTKTAAPTPAPKATGQPPTASPAPRPTPAWIPPGYSVNPQTGMLQRSQTNPGSQVPVKTQALTSRSSAPRGFGNGSNPFLNLGSYGAGASGVDTTGLSVQPDVNGSFTGSVSVNGQAQTVAITPDGKVYDTSGQEITSQFGAQDLSSLYQAFGQASGDPNYGSQLSQASTVLNTGGPTGVTPSYGYHNPYNPVDNPPPAGWGVPPATGPGSGTGAGTGGGTPGSGSGAGVSGSGVGQPPPPPPPPPGTTGITPPMPYQPYSPPYPGGGTPPNASNPFSGSPLGTGNPYNYLGEGYTDANGNYVPPALAGGNPGMGNYADYSGGSPFATPLDSQATNNRNITLSQGQSLDQSLQNYINYQSGQGMVAQDQLNSAYTPIANGQGGYSQDQKDAILNQPYLNSLQQTQGQADSNYLTPGEQAGIAGNPSGVMDQLASDEGAMDQNMNSNADAINSALTTQTGNVNNALVNTQGGVHGAVGQQYKDISGVMNATNPAVNNTLRQTATNTNSYINPTKLSASDDYMRDYNVSDRDQQNILDQAGATVGNQELSDEGRLLQEANAQGNTSPLALSAARERLRQRSAVGQAQAMTNAAVNAKQLQLNTTQGRENTRLGAEQNYAGLGTSTNLALGSQNLAGQEYLGQLGLQGAAITGAANIGAEQYLGDQAQKAAQYLGTSTLNNQQEVNKQKQQNLQYQTGQNVAAGETADQAASTRANVVAQNRQSTNAYNQGTQFQRGQYIYGQGKDAQTNFANTQLGQEAEYRNYLQGKQSQANQNVSVGNQQRLGAYGTQTGGINQATSVGVANYGTKPGDPTTATNLINSNGIINSGKQAKGGVSQGPHMALVGEAGPELIVDLSAAAKGDTADPYKNPLYRKIMAQMLGLGGGGGTTWGMDEPPDYADSLSVINNYTGSPSGSKLPGSTVGGGVEPDISGGTPRLGVGTSIEPGGGSSVGGGGPYPLVGWEPPTGPTGPTGSSSSSITFGGIVDGPSTGGIEPGGGVPGGGSDTFGGGDDYEWDALGSVSEPNTHHYYGTPAKLHKNMGALAASPNVELVDHPQIRSLGVHRPQAVIPLNNKKGNKTSLASLPGLMKKYGSYGAGRV